MLDPVSAVFDLIVQGLGQRIWQRPELAPLREPVEAAFSAGEVAHLARQAFDSLPAESRTALPAFLDEGFLRMPLVLDHIAAHLDTGQPADLDRLQELYASRHLDPASAPDVRPHLATYLGRLRETLSAHPTYGPLLLARDLQSLTMVLRNLHEETRRRFDDLDSALRDRFSQMEAQFEALLREPEVHALIERKASTHVFLSYSRKNIAQALRIRNAIAADGHEVWQDISAIKGGDQWLDAIDDGIRRAYAVVIVLSHEAWESYWVREEFAHAQRHNKRIIPVNVDGRDTPFGMNQLNPIEAHTSFEAALSRLQAALPVAPLHTDPPAPAAPLPVTAADPRQAERDYLNRVLLEYSVWKQLYTPMAGVARQRKDAPRRPARRAPASIQPVYIRKRIREAFPEQWETTELPVGDIAAAVRQVRHLVVLGEPGSGKSTTLWLLAASYAEAALNDPAAPLPLLLDLGALPAAVSLRDQLQRQLGDGLSLENLLAGKRLVLLLDALNELPAECRADKVDEVRARVAQAQREDTVAVVTCRRLDYTGDLDLGIPEKVDIAPLDPSRIRAFCRRYLPDDGETLFWALAGEDIAQYWQVWQRENRGDFDAFWASDAICRGTSRSDAALLGGRRARPNPFHPGPGARQRARRRGRGLSRHRRPAVL